MAASGEAAVVKPKPPSSPSCVVAAGAPAPAPSCHASAAMSSLARAWPLPASRLRTPGKSLRRAR